MMASPVYICLFDLAAYDRRVAPALRRYAREYDPAPVVALLRDVIGLLPVLRRESRRPLLSQQDYEHWIDSLGPDAGYKPSARTMREVSDLLIQPLCIPHGTGLNPIQDIGQFAPWLSERSEWFADLFDGGEELAGGRLEFTFGTGALIATRQQIRQFLGEIRRIPPPAGDLSKDYANLRKLLGIADANTGYTILKTSLNPGTAAP